MKKLVSLVLILMLLAVPALAESTITDTLTYHHVNGGYSFTYPADMVLMSKENIQELVDSILSGELTLDGMDADTLKAQGELMSQADMTMVMTKDGMLNVTLAYQNLGAQVTEEQFLAIYCPVMLQQYQALYPDCSVLDEGSVYTAGENTFVTQSLQLTTNGIDMSLVIIYGLNGTYMYNTVFTVADMLLETNADYVNEVVELIAASFVYSEPAAQ